MAKEYIKGKRLSPMPRTKGSKNRPQTTHADYASQIAEKREYITSLTAEIASITANIDNLKADLKEKKTALKKAKFMGADPIKKAVERSLLYPKGSTHWQEYRDRYPHDSSIQ